jgi:hypothetical protein
MEQWPSASLDAKRLITDEPADEIVRLVYSQGRRDVVNRLLGGAPGSGGTAELPPDLRARVERFLDEGALLPSFYDAERVRAAESLFVRHGIPILVAHVSASLPTCYTMKNGVHVLWQTEFLELHATPRLYQTAQLIVDAMSPGGLAPGGKGVATVQRVRLMHAAIRYLIDEAASGNAPPAPANRMEEMFSRSTWDPTWGRPVNQEDLAFTCLTFSHVTLRALDALGLPISAEQREGYLHAWSVVGHLLGIERELLVFDQAAARDLFERIEAHQAGRTEAAFRLTNSIKFFLARVLGIPLGVAERVLYVLVRHLAGDAVADRVGWASMPGTGLVADAVMEAVVDALDLEAALEDHSRGFAAVARWVGKRLIAGLSAVPPGAARGMFELPPELVTEWPG